MTHGPLMLDLQGLEITDEERELLKHPAAGGVILFARNFASADQVAALIKDIHAIREPQLLVAVDQEGGRVQRFKQGFTRLPPAAWFGELYDQQGKSANAITHEVGWLMATELRGVGVDFSFAPVLDLNSGLSSVIGDRAFHENPLLVNELANAWMAGAKEAGMPSVGKHFPGHGGVVADSHLALPIDTRPFDAIERHDLFPFQQMIQAGLDGIMPAHVIYESINPELAGFSTFWLQDILRHQLGFQGVIFSDDLTMAAAHEVGSVEDRAQAALDAGCDMMLVCNDQSAAVNVLDYLEDWKDPVSQSRLVRMHGRKSLARKKCPYDARWKKAVSLVGQYNAKPSMDLNL